MWMVVLIKAGPRHDYASNYFPREVRYKSDAIKIKNRVEYLGGEAVFVKSVLHNKEEEKTNGN